MSTDDHPRAGVTVSEQADEPWDDVSVRDCYTKVQGQLCGKRHGWGSWLNTIYLCPGTREAVSPGGAPLDLQARECERGALQAVLEEQAWRGLLFPCCDHCGCRASDRSGHDASCLMDCHLEQGICSCGNRFDGNNLCMLSACQEEV